MVEGIHAQETGIDQRTALHAESCKAVRGFRGRARDALRGIAVGTGVLLATVGGVGKMAGGMTHDISGRPGGRSDTSTPGIFQPVDG